MIFLQFCVCDFIILHGVVENWHFIHLLTVFIKQVCTHGLVSFGSPVANTSGSIPRGYGPPFIAANWFDFRTFGSSRNKGRVYYRSTSTGRNVELLFD